MKNKIKKLAVCAGIVICIFLYFLCSPSLFPEQITTAEKLANVQTEQRVEEFEILSKEHIEGYTTPLRVIHDNKRNVTCWKLANGLSCIPDHSLTNRLKSDEK